MKKTSLRRKLQLSKQSVAVLADAHLRTIGGGQKSILPETWACSWFECTFTLSQCG